MTLRVSPGAAHGLKAGGPGPVAHEPDFGGFRARGAFAAGGVASGSADSGLDLAARLGLVFAAVSAGAASPAAAATSAAGVFIAAPDLARFTSARIRSSGIVLITSSFVSPARRAANTP